jgi:hypothetical protein
MKPKPKMSKSDASFYQGFACALACLARDHGRPAMARDIMVSCSITLKLLREAGTDDFDLQPLRSV